MEKETTIHKLGMIMTDEELVTMAFRQYPNELWKKAFDLYNAQNPRLGLGCKSCYGKVLAWHLSKRLNAPMPAMS
jgi:hypothetical protein